MSAGDTPSANADFYARSRRLRAVAARTLMPRNHLVGPPPDVVGHDRHHRPVHLAAAQRASAGPAGRRRGRCASRIRRTRRPPCGPARRSPRATAGPAIDDLVLQLGGMAIRRRTSPGVLRSPSATRRSRSGERNEFTDLDDAAAAGLLDDGHVQLPRRSHVPLRRAASRWPAHAGAAGRGRPRPPSTPARWLACRRPSASGAPSRRCTIKPIRIHAAGAAAGLST